MHDRRLVGRAAVTGLRFFEGRELQNHGSFDWSAFREPKASVAGADGEPMALRGLPGELPVLLELTLVVHGFTNRHEVVRHDPLLARRVTDHDLAEKPAVG